MKLALNILICLYTAFISEAYAGPIDDVMLHGTTIASHGETVLTARSTATGLDVKVVFDTKEIDIGTPSEPKPKNMNLSCTYSRFPCSPVVNMGIVVNGMELHVPRNVFRDLADVDAAKIIFHDKSAVLTIVGGDASASYIETVQFDGEHVNRTTLASGMAPDKVLQETIYHYLPEDYFK